MSERSVIASPANSIFTPASTPPSTSKRSNATLTAYRSEMGTTEDTSDGHVATPSNTEESRPTAKDEATQAAQVEVAVEPSAKKRTNKCHKNIPKKKGSKSTSHGGRAAKDCVASDSSGDETSSDEDDEDETDMSSEDDVPTKKSKYRSKRSKKAKDKKRRKGKKLELVSDSESSSDSSDSSGEEAIRKRKQRAKKSKHSADAVDTDHVTSEVDEEKDVLSLETQVRDLMTRIAEMKMSASKSPLKARPRRSSTKSTRSLRTKQSKRTTYKRVDQLWDSSIHNYKLKESVEDDESEWSDYAFLVRRCFNWENKYMNTMVDIKAKPLRAALQEVMKECKSVSLEAEEPSIDPNVLFLYLEDLRTHAKKTLKTKIKSEKKKKVSRKLKQQQAMCKMLVRYIDEDYAETKKTLFPLLEAGNITFDLLWALFRPNDVAVTSCYGAWDEPRCFKVDYAMKYSSLTRGEWYCVEGKYLEYDGKAFGYGNFDVSIESFKGPRKISSLATYPLKYHKDPEGVKKQIVARGERFVAMEGMQYRFHKGLAFQKKKKQVLKININGRVMIDPANFRKVNANYPISNIHKREQELVSDSDEEDDCSCCAGDSDDEEADDDHGLESIDDQNTTAPKYKYKWTEDAHGELQYVAVEVDENGDAVRHERLDKLEGADTHKRTYTRDELLLTSPVVLGFAFSEKLWLEFSLSGVRDIEWNHDAFGSLVLEGDKKSTVRALVESHKFHAAKAIDDVVQGKGKGLVFVLHGPPGTGKTLTAEGISELLRCPLYIVSAGELGTDPSRLEQELQKILDIAHSWGALLLLDEADVFLEKREVHDIHRNALVSIFLRLLEYFQGILFLTTNRVETFDDAFQSRIQVALRYDELAPKARKEVWKNFINLVRKQHGAEVADFSEEDYTILSRQRINGRQIKNMVRTAQALALNEGKKLTMSHIRRVQDVAETFEKDLKGGTGYMDAMRSYT